MRVKTHKVDELASEVKEPVKKELKWRRLPNGLYSLFYEGGGELPAVLNGNYTSIFSCQKAINEYQKVR